MPLEFENGILGIQVQIDKLLDLADRKGIDVSNEVEVLREKLLERTTAPSRIRSWSG